MKTSIIYGLFVTSTWFVFVTSSKNFTDVPDLHGNNLDSESIVIEAKPDIQNAFVPSDADFRYPFTEWLTSIFTNPQYIKPADAKPAITTPKTPTNCPQCKCGIANQNNRIVDGHETKVLYYSWMCLLEYNGQFYCGCTLVNDRYVLTAAHCVSGFNARHISVRFLVHDRKNLNTTPSIAKRAASIIRHSQYSSITFNNDIALIKLDEPVVFNKLLRPACLPTRGKSFTGSKAVVTGWGALSQGGGSSPNKLQEVEVLIMSNAQCKESKYRKEQITDNMLCAGYPEGMKDACQGDSGGPLHVFDSPTSTYQVVGVVSWGEGCAQRGYPGVYSRVNRYLTWIKSNTADACYCD